jgi:hypothetical protein
VEGCVTVENWMLVENGREETGGGLTAYSKGHHSDMRHFSWIFRCCRASEKIISKYFEPLHG